MPSAGTYGPHSLKLIHLTLASIWYSVENFFLGLGRGIGSSALHPVTGWFRGYFNPTQSAGIFCFLYCFCTLYYCNAMQ